MKNAILLALMMSMTTITLTAQEISLGPVLGINGSIYQIETSLNDQLDFSITPGYRAGASIEASLGGRFSILAEPSFLRKGSKVRDDLNLEKFVSANIVDTLGRTMTENLNYISVPLMMKVRLTGKYNGLYALAGLSFDFGLNGKRNGQLLYYNPQREEILKKTFENQAVDFGSSNNDDYKKSDVGLTLGLGYFIDEVGPGKILIDFRYVAGLSSIFGKNAAFNIWESRSQSLKTRSLHFSVGYLFYL